MQGAGEPRLRSGEGVSSSGSGSWRSSGGAGYVSDGDEGVPWFDARDCFEGQDAQLDEDACVLASGALVQSPAAAQTSGPAAPLDDDRWLPPGGVSPQVRDAALAAMRRLITADRGETEACSEWEDRSPATCERFLRARDFDAGVAAALFLEHRAWRRSFGWSVRGGEVSRRQYDEQKIVLQALSRKGAPLLIIIARRHDRANRDMADITRFIIVTMDRIMDALRPGEQFVVLLDLAQLTRHNLDLKALVACFDILQKYYVERVQHIWFAQPPTIFWAAWRMVTPFVAPKTREKIAFLYGAEVTQTLLRHFEACDVPAEYGGTGALRPLKPEGAPWEAPGAPRQRRY